jgi:3-oxo-5alpha-steroid 4-dehydrogenase
MEEHTASRRNFIKGAVLASAAAVTAGLMTACDAPGGTNQESTDVNDVTWDKETDVIVVGFGGAGGAAAIEASKAGAGVVVLEIAEAGGGSTAINGGALYLGGGTALQKELGVDDSPDEMFNYLKAAAGVTGNEDALRLLTDGAAELYDWCLEVGMTFDKKVDFGHSTEAGVGLTYSGNELARAMAYAAKPAPRCHRPSPENSGMGFFRPIRETVESLGAEVMYETAGEHLVTDKAGRVIGVRARTQNGKELWLKAKKAVVLTTGGFTLDTEMITNNWVYGQMAGVPVACLTEMGDGIKMGLELGADTYGMSHHQIGASTYGRHPDLPKGIAINQEGRRFIYEDAYGSFVGEAIMESGMAYLLVDDTVQQVLAAANPDGFKPLASAQTVEELGANFGIPGAVLANTVTFYNDSISSGVDIELGKGAEYLSPIVTPPFHFHYFGPASCYFMTSGGLKMNLRAQVVSRSGDPIPGLYVAGRNGDITFGHYMASGTSMLDCLSFGRIAGKNAAAESSI